ncbi:hypothetical protein FRX31_014184 [Thalictrum thalictroides]|uniref:Uncharacterized protein n=1 Tax=Thalictrum thalictroides TaxID=46969 RepID=A0A7J6WHX8_THATH|nr:hypothetical protein FRX31_014184 [Thalictrum thalictroides]
MMFNFCLRVGSRETISIWSDPWVPGLPSRRRFGPAPFGAPVFVSDLIDHISFQWNGELLNVFFQPVEMSAILNIKLSRALVVDDWIWLPEKNGCFSVKLRLHLEI